MKRPPPRQTRLVAAAATVLLLIVGAASFSDSLPGFIARVENRLGLPHIGEPALHFAGWMLVTILVVVAVRRPVPRGLAVAGVLVLGLVIEVLQPMLSSSRSYEADDIVANVLGVAVGFAAGTRLARSWDRLAGDGDGSGGPHIPALAFITAYLGPLLVAVAVTAVALAFALVIGLNPMIMLGLVLAVGLFTVITFRLLVGGPIDWTDRPDGRRLLGSALIAFLAVGAAIQVIPYGWDHTNPPVTAEPEWDSPETRALVVRACFDCHSNEVEYPWYAKVAPLSWAIQSHVEDGRAEVNYSEWDRPQHEAEESAETVREGEMPPSYYTWFTHADARLTDAEQRDLVRGLVATFGDDD